MNKVILRGNLGKEPEALGTASVFSLATTERYKDQQGQSQKVTSWHHVIAYGKLAEICASYLSKGSGAIVEGRIQYREDNQDGQKRRYTNIVAEKVHFLDKARETPF